MNDKRKILILGGEGFIGRNIATEMTNDFYCFSFDNKESVFNFDRKDIFMKGNPYIDKIEGKFDIYIHLIDNQASDKNFEEEEMKLINNVFFAKGSHLIVFSSAVVYANPSSPYAKRKIKLERLYENYCASHDINLTIFRLFNIYGKFQMPYKQGSLIANILFGYKKGIPIEINDMSTKRDYIYAGDMAKFVRFAVENKFYGKTDLATGKLISIGKLLNTCEKKIFLKKVEIIDKKSTENNLCPLGNNVLIEKVKIVSLEAGLMEALSFFEKNLDTIKKYLNT